MYHFQRITIGQAQVVEDMLKQLHLRLDYGLV